LNGSGSEGRLFQSNRSDYFFSYHTFPAIS
jgi:hypothetical protein